MMVRKTLPPLQGNRTLPEAQTATAGWLEAIEYYRQMTSPEQQQEAEERRRYREWRQRPHVIRR